MYELEMCTRESYRLSMVGWTEAAGCLRSQKAIHSRLDYYEAFTLDYLGFFLCIKCL